MKLLIGSMILAAAGAAAYGQTAVAPAVPAAPAMPADARVIAELAAAASQLGGVKNSPFSAEEVNESVQTLADGNRIVHSSTNKVYRNGEGRMRRDIQGGAMGGVLGTTFTYGGGYTIVDPQMRQQILLDTETKIASIADLKAAGQAYTVLAGPKAIADTDRAKYEARIKELQASGEKMTTDRQALETAERALVTATRAPMAVGAPVTVIDGVGVYNFGNTSKYETRTEELGTRDFEGVAAEGRRTVTTIPAGAIGNERPIEVTYERWYSKDLGMVVYSHRSDPRTGETTYQLKNIVRAEPDPGLFNIPQEYKKVSSGSTVYRTSPQAVKAETAAGAKPATATYVKNNRP